MIWKRAKEIRAKLELTSVDQKILLSNELFLYLVLNDHQKFWISASYLPKELKYEFSCAGYEKRLLEAKLSGYNFANVPTAFC